MTGVTGQKEEKEKEEVQEDRDENDYEESSRQIAKFPEDIRLTGCVYEMECNTRVDSQPLALLK